MTPNTITPRSALATMKPPKAPAPTAAFSLLEGLRQLDALQVAAGSDKPTRVILLITECIDEGLCAPTRIASILVALGHNRGHVWRIIREGTGSNPALHRWWPDAEGNLHLHQAADA